MEDLRAARRLRWLGHLSRMEDDRLPKKMLFGWLPQCRPEHGTKLRWKDRVRQDLKKFKVVEDSWFPTSQDRWLRWRVCKDGPEAGQSQVSA